MAKPTLTVAQPIAQPTDDGALAPWPAIDKYPIIIGPGLSLSYISSIFRLSLIGYRQQYVDLLDELLEKDPHAFSVLSKRVLGVAGGRLELTPGVKDNAKAKEICDGCTELLACIPDLEGHLAEMAWAAYYAIVGLETHWARDGASWVPERLSLVHSRRLSYPVAGSWDLYVWDQGQVLPGQYYGQGVTNSKTFGARVADYPGKFIVHAPQIRGNYPTRNGLGRQIAYWLALKLIATRGAPQYLERFAKPWPEATYSTGPESERKPASKEDIAAASEALKAMGAGSLASWVHADTIALGLRTPDNGAASKLTFPEWIAICDAQVSKAVVGGTLSTDVGTTGGNRSLGETQKKSETMLLKHDAKQIASSLKRDLITWMVRLNFPTAPLSMVPNVDLHVEDPPDPMVIIDRAAKAVTVGMPVDADALAAQVGIPLVSAKDTKARRLYPCAPIKNPTAFDADLAAREKLLVAPSTSDTEPDVDDDNSSPAIDDPDPSDEEPDADDEA